MCNHKRIIKRKILVDFSDFFSENAHMKTQKTDIATTLDARGLLCPLPVLKIRKSLLSLQKGDILRVLCDDPISKIDVAHFCNEQGHILHKVEKEQSYFVFFIEKQ